MVFIIVLMLYALALLLYASLLISANHQMGIVSNAIKVVKIQSVKSCFSNLPRPRPRPFPR